MAEAPLYTTVPGRIPELLKKIRVTGVPDKVTHEWLRSVGFTSSNDRSLISVLRQIRFIDDKGIPQSAWQEWRGSDYRRALGRAIMLGYEMLYSTYPDAHERTSTELAHILATKTKAGKQTVDKMVATFKYLTKEADFSSAQTSGGAAEEPSDVEVANGEVGPQAGWTSNDPAATTITPNSGCLTINVNVQLTIPETTDEKVFDAFFRAMRRNLIDGASSE